MIQQLNTIQTIPFTNIESSKRWCLHPFLKGSPPPQLRESIERIGLLHPPTVQEISSGKFLVICGHFRVQVVQQLLSVTSSIPCRILPQNSSTKNILDLIIGDQLLSGPLSSIEKGFFFNICGDFMDSKTIASSYLPLLGEKIQEHSIKKTLQLLTLSLSIQTSIHTGTINDKVAFELLSLNSADRDTIYTLFQKLGLGGGKQKRLLSLCKDLVGRDGLTVQELFAAQDLQDIVSHKEMNPPQKGMLILSTLNKRLFPNSIAAEQSFSKQIKAMNLPNNCSVTHSPSFETDAVSLSIHFPSLTSVQQLLPEIQKLANQRKR